MERIPILKMGEYLLVTIQVDMHDRLAITLVELGLPLKGVRTALNVEHGMAVLKSRLERHDEQDAAGRR